MRERKPQLIITFANTSEAIKMEKFCMEHGLPGRMIPVPSQITAGCGLAWKTDPDKREEMMKHLFEADMKWERMQIITI